MSYDSGNGAELLEVKNLVMRGLTCVDDVYNDCLRPSSYNPQGFADPELLNDMNDINIYSLFEEIHQMSEEELRDLRQETIDWLELTGQPYGDLLLDAFQDSRFGGYMITSSAGPVAAVGRTITYKAIQLNHHFIAEGSTYHYRWYCENDSTSRNNYSDGSRTPLVVERNGLIQWMDESFGDPSDIDLRAVYPGVHLIKVDVSLNDKFLSTAVFRQTIVEGDPEILAMSLVDKILIALEMSLPHLGPTLVAELGDLRTLALMLVTISAILIALAGTPVGLVAEIIVLALGIVVASKQLIEGFFALIKFFTVVSTAGTREALEEAGVIFAEAAVKLGLGALFLVLSYFGVKRVRNNVHRQITQGRATIKMDMRPGSPAHKAQRWIDYQLKHPERYPRITEKIEPRWSRLYDTIIENGRAGRGFEGEALGRFNYTKNNHLFMNEAQNRGFIPDAIKGNPTTIEWGKPYDFVEVKGWNNLSNTGNVKSMISYVREYGGSIELIIRSDAHASGATEMSGPLVEVLDALRMSGKASIRIYP